MTDGAAPAGAATRAAAAPRDPAGPAPLRRPGSLRRTSTLDTGWPEGPGKTMRMQGHCRDALTPVAGGAPVTVAEEDVQLMVSPLREILAISSSGNHPALPRFVGARGGGHSRAILVELLRDEGVESTPLHLLLDDFAGASLVAGWAWSRWVEDWRDIMKAAGTQSTAGRGGQMAGVCTGFAPGSGALADDGGPRQDSQSFSPVPSLQNPDDPEGWHPLAEQQGTGMRRARRLDIWLEDGDIHIDAGFQDSATAPGGGRVAIHEYRVRARADSEGRLAEIEARPHVLPYAECPGAVPNVQRLVGRSLRHFRLSVLRELPGTAGCTHLNDVLRSLADVPALVSRHLG